MANIVDIQTIVDGGRNHIVKVFLDSDGVAGELTDQVLIDVSALTGVTNLYVEKIWYNFTGFTARLEWDATGDDELFHLSEGDGIYDFTCFGGIPNPKSAGSTGDLTITTTGFTAAGDEGVLVLYCRKQ